MVVIFKEISRTIQQMAMESILIEKDTNMKVNGKITYRMVRAKQFTLIKRDMLVNSSTIEDMEGEHYFNRVISIVVALKMIFVTVSYNFVEKMVKIILDNGNRIKSMDMDSTNGLMEVNMKDTM